MRNTESNIRDDQASYYINKLYDFIGHLNIEQALKKHNRAIDLSGPIVSRTILRNRHPWWEAFGEIIDMKKRGMSIKKHLTPGIKKLVADGLRISKLRQFMPDSVQRKYKRDLIDKHRAFDYLFEIQIAWHYYLKGHDLQWYEDDGEKHPEFLVKTPSFDFNVECKKVSVDMRRKITREDFSRFSEKLFSEIENKQYSGNIDITLNDRLESNKIDLLVGDTIKLLNHGEINQISEMSYGKINLNLEVKNGNKITFKEISDQLLDSKDLGKHIAFFCNEKIGDDFIDPVIVSIKSEKPDKVLHGIYDKMYEAASDQLIDSMPGIIVAFLEDVYDLRYLRSGGTGLQIMTNELLNKKKFSHIAGISYCSETQILKNTAYETYNSQNLFFRNSNCKFEDANNYPFIDQQ